MKEAEKENKTKEKHKQRKREKSSPRVCNQNTLKILNCGVFDTSVRDNE